LGSSPVRLLQAHRVTLRRWSFLQRTPQQRLERLIEMLEIGYASGAIQPRRPQHVADAVQEPAGGQSAADRARS
jgi:hypothetical protein